MSNQVVVAFTIQQAQALLDAFVQYPRSLLEKNVDVCGALDAIESTLVNEHGEEEDDNELVCSCGAEYEDAVSVLVCEDNNHGVEIDDETEAQEPQPGSTGSAESSTPENPER